MTELTVLHLPVFSTHKDMEVHIRRYLCDMKSDYQHIQIADTEKFGKSLIIDGLMQTSETDHTIYDKEMVRMLHCDATSLLILGGGDGYLALQVLRLFPNTRITVVDIDRDVTLLCNKYLHVDQEEKALLDHVSFLYEDVAQYLGRIDEKYDGIISDLTDFPIGFEKVDSFTRFYKNLLSKVKASLVDDGWVGIQAGSRKTAGSYIPSEEILKDLFSQSFYNVERSYAFIPSYGEEWSFLHGKR